jgi:UDP-N-acetylmuramate dehydrogenase
MDKRSLMSAGVAVTSGALLKDYTTFRLGGSCKLLLDCRTPDQLFLSVNALLTDGNPFIVIGAGSNLVVSDKGVDCAVIRYVSENPLMDIKDNVCEVSGSTLLDNLVETLAEQGWSGLNFASGIPGTVGGAVVGNAGAYGRQVGDVVRSVELIDFIDGSRRCVFGKDLDFAYRNSRLKNHPAIVASVVFQLTKAESSILLNERRAILDERSSKHPDWKREPSAGSFFRNIEPTSQAGRRQAAGWFLEKAGVFGLSRGGAVVYPRHANIITTTPGATANDVYLLAEEMREAVQHKYGLALEREARFVGNFDGMPKNVGWIW